MLLVGAVALEVVISAPGVRSESPWVAHVGAASFLALAVAAGQVAIERYRVVTLITVVVSVALLSAFIALADGIGGLETFYLWPMLGAAYLLRRREVIGLGILTIAAYAEALALSPSYPGFPTGQFLLVTGASAVVVGTVRALAENLHRLIRALRTSSATDPLTGLLNRRSFDRRFGGAVVDAERGELPLAVMLLDLDHFKQVNDEHGHAVGDRALVRFAELLLSQSRASDLVARVGGEEFAVVLPGATVEQALRRAEQFAQAWRVERSIDGLALTVSVGVTALGCEDETPSSLLMRADAAVYRAKADGRDRVALAQPGATYRAATAGTVDRRTGPRGRGNQST
jgi:diguanylate cyclase (GGDEF)-like protein